MSNLKVNARTKILEFKAKHNKLVDEVNEVSAELPVIEETTNRFKKVYIDELPQDIRDFIDSHFNDDDSTITLSAEELNNYIWKNLANLCNNASDTYFNDTSIFASQNLEFDEFLVEDSISYYSTGQVTEKVNFDLFTEDDIYAKFSYMYDSDEEVFSTPIIWYLTLANYSAIKQVMIKDLLANMGYILIDSSEQVDNKIASAVAEIPTGTKLYFYKEIILHDYCSWECVDLKTTGVTFGTGTATYGSKSLLNVVSKVPLTTSMSMVDIMKNIISIERFDYSTSAYYVFGMGLPRVATAETIIYCGSDSISTIFSIYKFKIPYSATIDNIIEA